MWKYGPPDDHARPVRIAAQMGIDDLRDLSAGQWRQVIPGAAAEAANPGHERIKFLGHDAHGARQQLRCAGLGSWGAAAVTRARALAAAGISPAVAGDAQGFLALSWIDAKRQPATTSHNATVPGGTSGEHPEPGSTGQHAKGDEPIQKQNSTNSKV